MMGLNKLGLQAVFRPRLQFRAFRASISPITNQLQHAQLHHLHPLRPTHVPAFDTHSFVTEAQTEAALKPQEAAALMVSVSSVLDSNLLTISQNAITRDEFDKVVYSNNADFNHLRSDISLVEKNDFTILKTEITRLSAEVDRIGLRTAEEFRRIMSGTRLDLHTEKSRVRDHQNDQAIHLKEADAKIESELASLKTLLDGVHWELFKTLFPLFSAAFALIFSYLRFMR